MPVKSLNSSVLKWPDAQLVDQAVRHWAERVTHERDDVRRIGYFGSYARGDWGVGSDLDLIVVLDHTDLPFAERSREWDTTGLPVPADVLVYTQDEWLTQGNSKFYQTLLHEAVWIYGNDCS